MSAETVEKRIDLDSDTRLPFGKVLGSYMTRYALGKDELNGFQVVAQRTRIPGVFQAEVRIPHDAEDSVGPVVRQVAEADRAMYLASVDKDGIIDPTVIELAAPGPIVEELAEALGVAPKYIEAA
jgi:hypothetical protein